MNSQPRIPEFIELLEQSKAIHLKKNADYASDNNPFSNFERSAELISWFSNKEDKGFIGLIGTKLARLAELGDGRIPNNESVDDSFLDLLTYVGLWAAYRKRFPYNSSSTKIYSQGYTSTFLTQKQIEKNIIDNIQIFVPAPLNGERYEDYGSRCINTVIDFIKRALKLNV